MKSITQYCKECYENAKEKGFHPPNQNIGEILMLIVTEIAEAIEAYNNNKFSVYKVMSCLIENGYTWEDSELSYTECFKRDIKDTFEDKIADTFIRLFDLAGLLVEDKFLEIVEQKSNKYHEIIIDNIGEIFFNFITGELYRIKYCIEILEVVPAGYIGEAIGQLFYICKKLNIDIYPYIDAKMAYNKTREYKHGKQY